ncbi:hypothetical protein HDU86_002698 [Geranomyces michiganensis]|nr:hypothetical protein HDU86_002698 [Geranomyces michiganensis]
MIFICLFLLAAAWVISARLASPSPAASSSAGHKVYFAETYHARFKPVRHAFKYPLFYFGIDLDADDGQSPRAWRSWLWGWGWPAIFSIYARDHLKGEAAPLGRSASSATELRHLKEKLLDILTELAVPREEIGRVEFVSTPRVLGYCFNPLSLYYCYHPTSGILTTIVMEVNNTFGERHVYIADQRNKLNTKAAGYTCSYKLNRAFHVSPFNNRSGVYEAHFKDPADGQLDVLLNIKRYQPLSAPDDTCDTQGSTLDSLWLTARVSGSSRPLTTRTCVYLALSYPLTAFMTIPRILKEAYKLAYGKRLKVYQKPGQFLEPPDGDALVRKPVQGFALWAADIVGTHVAHQMEHSTSALTIAMPNGVQHFYEPPGGGNRPALVLRVITANFFCELAGTPTDVGGALLRTFVRGDWTCAPQELGAILAVFRSPISGLVDDQPLRKNINRASRLSFAPLCVPIDWRSRFYRMKSLTVTRLAQLAFGKIANFRIDPYGVAERIRSYENDIQAGVPEGKSRLAEAAAWIADTGVDPEARQRARFMVMRRELL